VNDLNVIDSKFRNYFSLKIVVKQTKGSIKTIDNQA